MTNQFVTLTLDFGDSPASESLEIAQKKYILPKCNLDISKLILARNCLLITQFPASCFQQQNQIKLVSDDLLQAHNKYNWPLKPKVTLVFMIQTF